MLDIGPVNIGTMGKWKLHPGQEDFVGMINELPNKSMPGRFGFSAESHNSLGMVWVTKLNEQVPG